MIRFVKDREIYEQVIRDRVPFAKKRLWISTADINDMYVDSTRGSNPCAARNASLMPWISSASAGMGNTRSTTA